MAFDVAADAYDRFMGRYSRRLAPQLADLAGVAAGQRALDVGSGPGALTEELVARLGPDAVTAVDPSPSFVAALRERLPGVRAETAAVERLPFDAAAFDVTLAQLVVHFLAEPVVGLREMARVTRPGGVVAACVWDFAGACTPLGGFWRAARELDPSVLDESERPGAHEGQLGELLRAAGLAEVEETALLAPVEAESFEDWWEPFTLGVGPAGAHLARLEPEAREALRDTCRSRYAPAATVRAWAARGRAR